MSKNHKVTHAQPFHPVTTDAGRDSLFMVRPGIPLTDAIESAQCMLDSVTRALRGFGVDTHEQTAMVLWALSQVTESVDAVMSSAWQALNDAEAASRRES